ncbi:protein JASON-like isoform X2 [Phalaenopsis equestris]|nr:protein JASON-like isoform X2 [Phalaenopsis equestris]
MGCFLGCFRIKDDGSRKCHVLSKFYSWKRRDLVLDRNQYSSMVLSEERGSPTGKAEQVFIQESFDGDDSVNEKLRQEAKFLKTCGAILETPIEIRQASVQQSAASDPHSIKINWDQQLEKTDNLPAKDPETLIFKEDTLESCKYEENNDEMRKIVRFEELNHSVAGKINSSGLDISPQTEDGIQPHGSESPYPTPLNLLDEMQTPGTIYPPKWEKFNHRIRAQFVYPVPALSQSSYALCEDREKTQKAQPSSLDKELRPPLPKDGKKNMIEPSHSDKSPDEDGPIIIAAAASSNDEELSRISPKQWDGNGIPNSTTKYKEDQRVSWHATPFEVRLEKALWDERVYPPRKLDGGLVGIEDESRV